jgi:PTS system nitrogen regulatory IIA component
MLLSELLRADLIKVSLDARDKREAIGELVDLLVQRHEIALSHRAEVLDELRAHESTNVSGMEHGIAVPHGLSDRVEDLICALGISKAGVDFQAIDGKPSQIVLLLIAPKRSFAGEVRALAGIQHLFESATLKDRLLAAATADGAFEAIRDAEAHL